MITTKSCSTCEHFPNDHHCGGGCVWDEYKGENTKWELKENPIVIERKVLDKLRAEIEELDGKYVIGDYATYGKHSPKYVQVMEVLQVIDKYRNEVKNDS